MRVDAASMEMAIVMQLTFGLEQPAAARKDDIGSRQQLALALDQVRWRAAEFRELVHAIVDREPFAQLASKSRNGHRVIEPLHRVFELPGARSRQELLHQPPAFPIHVGPISPA